MTFLSSKACTAYCVTHSVCLCVCSVLVTYAGVVSTVCSVCSTKQVGAASCVLASSVYSGLPLPGCIFLPISKMMVPILEDKNIFFIDNLQLYANHQFGVYMKYSIFISRVVGLQEMVQSTSCYHCLIYV